MTRHKGTKPEQFAGPFQSYSEIPSRYKLATYTTQYEGEKTWHQYCDEVLFEAHNSTYMRSAAAKAEKSWLEHMEQRNRHHALATPADVNAWCEQLLAGDRCRRTCYEQYFVRVYQFYDYLKNNYQHPHHYNPLLLAAIEYDATRHVWMYRIEARPEVSSRE